MDGGWLDVELTCNEYATGGLEDADNADLLWTPSSGGITHALLYADVTVDDDTNTLHLHKETPQGATAIMKLPLAASTAKLTLVAAYRPQLREGAVTRRPLVGAFRTSPHGYY